MARKRVRELDAKFEELVDKVRAGGQVDCPSSVPIQVAPVHFQGGSPFVGTTPVAALARPYAVPTDAEVLELLAATGERIHRVLLFCLLSGMRSGEASGLLREDLVPKGNLGTFAHVRPNVVWELKTESAERLVPLHPVLQDLLPSLPADGPLFPSLSVAIITKDFAALRGRLGLARPGLVFHSTRKWFVTQCERAGVPEYYTASLVGHASARSENGLTYSIYSAGISDEQKRGIVDSIRLPE